MVTIFMMSATLGLLKIKIFFKIMIMTSQFMSMTSPTRFYHVAQIILPMWSCDQSLVTLAFL